MKKIIGLLCVCVLAAGLAACGKASAGKTETTAAKADQAETTAAQAAETEPAAAGGLHHVEIAVKAYGTIKVELDADTAPVTVENFLQLAGSGFYDGLTFHRIIDGFMIQGGDPLGNGTGGSSQHITGEFKKNGVDNPISHVRGVISMARAQDYNSASSQFFIVQADSTFLDGEYAAFGNVTEGIEIVDQICKDTQVEDNNGSVKKENQPVIEKITVVD